MSSRHDMPSHDPTSPEQIVLLAQRVRDGDVSAFETIFRTYYPALRRFAFGYTRSLDAAEDLVQDVMLAVWRRRAEFSVHTSPVAYLYSAVRNGALKRIEHDSVVQRHVLDAESVGAHDSPPADELFFATDLERAAHAQVEALPVRLREVYQLRRYEGLSHAEIAEVLGISAQAVYMRLSRALATLEVTLAPWIT